jgi:hypothetical protein
MVADLKLNEVEPGSQLENGEVRRTHTWSPKREADFLEGDSHTNATVGEKPGQCTKALLSGTIHAELHTHALLLERVPMAYDPLSGVGNQTRRR